MGKSKKKTEPVRGYWQVAFSWVIWTSAYVVLFTVVTMQVLGLLFRLRLYFIVHGADYLSYWNPIYNPSVVIVSIIFSFLLTLILFPVSTIPFKDSKWHKFGLMIFTGLCFMFVAMLYTQDPNYACMVTTCTDEILQAKREIQQILRLIGFLVGMFLGNILFRLNQRYSAELERSKLQHKAHRVFDGG